MLVFWYVNWCLFFFLLFTLFSFFFLAKIWLPTLSLPPFQVDSIPSKKKKTRLYSGTPHKPTTPHTIITLTNTHSHTFEQLFLGTLGCPQVSRIGRSKGISRACSFLLSSFLLLTPLLTWLGERLRSCSVIFTDYEDRGIAAAADDGHTTSSPFFDKQKKILFKQHTNHNCPPTPHMI